MIARRSALAGLEYSPESDQVTMWMDNIFTGAGIIGPMIICFKVVNRLLLNIYALLQCKEVAKSAVFK